MIDGIKTVIITEKTEKKSLLIDNLSRMIGEVSVVDSMVDGLNSVKRNHQNLAIISADIKDYYSLDRMVKILQDVGTIQKVLLVTEDDTLLDESIKTQYHIILLSDIDTACSTIFQEAQSLKNTIEEEGSFFEPLEEHLDEYSGLSLVDSVPTGLYRIDKEGDFLEANKTLVHLLRAPDTETLLADNFFSLFYDADDRHTWKEIMERDALVRGLVYEIERYDGQPIWVRDTARAVCNEKGTMCQYNGSIEDITYEKKLEDKLSFLATQDILTGLPNRNFFQDQAKLTISQARYNDDMIAFLVVDLDFFTDINDTHGHKNGDRLLQMVATRIKSQLRKSDLVSRLGGDKFISLLSGIRTKRDVLAVAKKISQIFEEPFLVGEIPVTLSGSIGISLFPEHGDEVNSLIKHAEIATYAVKERKRGGYMIYSDVIHTGYPS